MLRVTQRNRIRITTQPAAASTSPDSPNGTGLRRHGVCTSIASRPGPVNSNANAHVASRNSYSNPAGGPKNPPENFTYTALAATPRIPAAASGLNSPTTSNKPPSDSVSAVIQVSSVV